jgi:hypothetical protein
VCREGKQIIPTLNIYITPMRLLEVKAKRFLTADKYQPQVRTTEPASVHLRQKQQFGSVLGLGSEGFF